MAGSPSASRSTAGHIYTFINGRYVRDRVVQHAVMQGYKNVMERGRYPVLVLSINLASGDVDVNVHPTKHEVRFRDQTKIHGAIQGAIETHLQSANPFRSGGVPLQPRQYSPASSQAVSRVTEVKDSLLRYVAANQSAAKDNVFRSYPASFVGEIRQSDGTSVSYPPSDEVAEESHLSVKIIGQFRSAYLVCEEGNDLLIIDQHAAHERVVFQELRDSFRSGAIDGQNLLFPETITLSPLDNETLKEHITLLQKFGFDFEEFGRNSWLLRSIPLVLAGQDYRQALLDILSELAGHGVSSLIDDKIDEILSRVACHSVVRGEWHLSSTEIAGLLNRMSQTAFATNCPHGRPVVARIGLKELEKMFKR
jgi:DNA mismatch repair protein MutL